MLNKSKLMVKVTQNVNLLVECEGRFHNKPWYNSERISALLGRLAYLDENEINLVLDLTERFQYLELNEVSQKLVRAYNSIPDNILLNATSILFVPLKSPYYKDMIQNGKARKRKSVDEELLAQPSKSSDFILKIVDIGFPYRYQKYSNKTHICKAPGEVLKYYQKGALLVLWDDFIGSGNTAFNAIADLQKFLVNKGHYPIEKDFIIVCVCAMKKGLDMLNYLSLNCYACDVYMKAISDDQRFGKHDRDVRILTMKSVEEKVVKCSKEFSLGFEQSEALLSIFDRCPNNTFPFYWHRSKYQLDPVFYRYK